MFTPINFEKLAINMRKFFYLRGGKGATLNVYAHMNTYPQKLRETNKLLTDYLGEYFLW